MSLQPLEDSRRSAAALRWGTAFLCVAALHVAGGWWIVQRPVATRPPDTVQGIAIDLEPVAVPPSEQTAAQVPAGGPAAAPVPQPEAPQAEQPATVPRPVEPTPPQAAISTPPPDPPAPAQPPPEMLKESPPEPTPDQTPPNPAPEAKTVDETPPPTLPQRNTPSDSVMAPPPPRPRPQRPDPRIAARAEVQRKLLAEARAAKRAAQAEAHAEAAAQNRVRAAQVRESGGPSQERAGSPSASSGASVATWRGAVVAHLNAFRPAATGASGTAQVAFSVDRSGRVMSASLAGSSGDPGLDAAAVAMVRRANPVPAPPPELGGRVNLSVPVHFR